MRTGKLQLNLALLWGGEGLAKLLALFAWGWLGHVLTDDRFGLLAFPVAAYFVANQLLDAGLAPFGAREAARHPARTGVLAARISCVRLLLVAAALVLLALLALALVEKPADERLVLVLFGTALLPMPWLANWAFEARDRMGVVAWGTLLRQVVFAGGIVLSVRDRSDLPFVPLCEAAGLATQAAVHQVAFRRRFGAFAPWRGRRGAGSTLRSSLPLGASTLFSALRWFAPLLLLSATTNDPAEAAHLDSSQRIVVSAHTFVWLYFVNLLPSMARLAASGDRDAWRRLARTSLSVVAWTVTPALLVGAALAPLLLPAIFGATFRPAADVFRVQVWMLLAAFLSGHHRYGLVAFRCQRAEMAASAAGAAVSTAGAAILLASGALDAGGAAVCFVAGEVATLALAAGLLGRAVTPLPWLSGLAPVAVPAAASVALGALLAPDRPLLAAGLVVACFAAALAVARPAFLRRRPPPGAEG